MSPEPSPTPRITRREREALNGHRGGVVYMTGLSGAGKSTIAALLEDRLHALDVRTCVLDGDVLRGGISRDLGFSDADRIENVRRVTEVARLLGTNVARVYLIKHRLTKLLREALDEFENAELDV